MYYRSVGLFSRIYDLILREDVKPSRDLITACEYLNLEKSLPGRVVKSSIVLTIVSMIASGSALLFLFFNDALSLLLTGALLFIPLLVNHLYSNYYKDLYYERRVEDLGFLPDFFSLVITNLKINPNLENALINVSRFDYGKATRDSKRLVKDFLNGKDWDVKKSFINMMKLFGNASVDSATNSLISALSIRDNAKRVLMFNNSLKHLLNGMVDETKNFARNIYAPILLLFGFGTIIPLIVISIVPVVGLLKGSSFNITTIASFFAVSILVVKLVINNLKKKSPSRFSQVVISEELRGVNLFLLLIIFIGVSSPAIIYFFSNFLPFTLEAFKGYQSLFAYAALTITSALYFFSKTKKLVSQKFEAQALENELIDSFYLLASRINEGHSVESSLKYVGEVINDGRAKVFFRNAYHKISNLGLSVDAAFSRAHMLKNVFSQRIKGLVELFVTSVKKHSISASENLIEVCNYYNEIRDAEKEMINSMSKNIDMVKLTAYFFSPVVCALIINIQRLINSVISEGSVEFLKMSFSAIDIELVQLVISFYLFFLTIIMSELYSFLTSNNERVSLGWDAFKAAVTSALVFTATLIISRFLLF